MCFFFFLFWNILLQTAMEKMIKLLSIFIIIIKK